MSSAIRTAVAVTVAVVLSVAGCGSSGPNDAAERRITLYTSVTQDTVDSVVAGFEAAHPGTEVEVFRAPTGQLNTRIAADRRAGEVRADVIWGTDPLSTHTWVEQGLLMRWPLPDVTGIPDEYKTDYFWGTRVLNLVIVAHDDLTPLPIRWADLADPAYRGQVALPDPAVAGSALAALGYLGTDFYRRLEANGAVQVSSIPQVVTDVAQGRYQLGITLARTARNAIEQGSPLRVVWPQPGAIALYSPIGIFKATDARPEAESFARYVLGPEAQRRISETGWTPARTGVTPPFRPPPGAGRVSPDWEALFDERQRLLRTYQTIFGP